MIIKSVFCLIISINSGLAFAKQTIQCNDESKQKIDLLLMEMTTLGDPNGHYPTNQEELAETCKNERKKLSWSKLYTDQCLHGISQQLMSVSMRDLERSLNKYCDSPRLSKLFISWSECGNKAINQTVKCWRDYVLDMDRINLEKERIPDPDKTPLICCNYHRFDHCIEESLISKGSAICSQNSVSGIHSLLNEVIGKTIEILCGDYAVDNDKCDSINNKYSHLNDIKFDKPMSKSPLNPFVEIIGNAAVVLNFKASNETDFIKI